MIKSMIFWLLALCAIALNADVKAVVSIAPQMSFVKAIGGDKVDVALMVKPGNSPHSYEPKPSQMKDIAKADIYFALDLEFEHVWLDKFKSQNKKMKVIELDEGIEKIAMDVHSDGEHEEDEHEHHEHEEHKHEGLDPHIWTSPANVKIIARNIYDALIKADSLNKEFYKTNYEEFLEHISKTDESIKSILSNVKSGSKFMVFHPAWGYFAKEYALVQVAIEVDGKNPKPKQLMHLIEEVKEENIKAIFAAPEFSDKAARQIAKESGVLVLKISPLEANWSKNLQRLAKAVANKSDN